MGPAFSGTAVVGLWYAPLHFPKHRCTGRKSRILPTGELVDHCGFLQLSWKLPYSALSTSGGGSQEQSCASCSLSWVLVELSFFFESSFWITLSGTICPVPVLHSLPCVLCEDARHVGCFPLLAVSWTEDWVSEPHRTGHRFRDQIPALKNSESSYGNKCAWKDN